MQFSSFTPPDMLAVFILLIMIRPAIAIVRFARCPVAAKRHYPAMIRARLRWKHLARQLGFARLEVVNRSGDPALDARPVMHHPKARFRADEFGWHCKVRTVPKVGRAQLEQASDHVANAWRCHRVSVTQTGPGRLVLRGMRRDPLAEPFGQDGAPDGIYDGAPDPTRLYVGRDEFGTDRYAPIAGLTGVSVVGLPGYGKTSLVLSWLMQLAGSGAVQFVFIDGKNGGDYRDWAPRAWLLSGDELDDAAGTLEQVHSLMRDRLRAVGTGSGPRNRWHAGPTVDYPLIVTVIDECHTFFDLDAVKGNKEADLQTRACRHLTAQLVKKGRSCLFLTLLITQKGTSDAVPTAIRDLCGLGLAFATTTTAAAVAGLGERIKEYPSYCPTGLRDRSMIGVTTASMMTGADPFVRIRVPFISEDAAWARALATASMRQDPSGLVPAVPRLVAV
jgi:S-DNA-T family DNA segregation ATPase FtsK/SpoIIIE